MPRVGQRAWCHAAIEAVQDRHEQARSVAAWASPQHVPPMHVGVPKTETVAGGVSRPWSYLLPRYVTPEMSGWGLLGWPRLANALGAMGRKGELKTIADAIASAPAWNWRSGKGCSRGSRGLQSDASEDIYPGSVSLQTVAISACRHSVMPQKVSWTPPGMPRRSGCDTAPILPQ